MSSEAIISNIGLVCFVIGTSLLAAACWKWIPGRDRTVRIVATAGCIAAQWILATQILSLIHALAALNFGVLCLAIALALWGYLRKLPQPPASPDDLLAKLIEHARASRVNITLLGVSMAVCVIFPILGLLIHPHTDIYHLSSPVYWIQHGTIKPFPVENFRISSFAPGGDILQLPFFLFLNFDKSNVLLGAAGMAFVPILTWNIARRCGFAPQSAYVAAVSSLGITPVTYAAVGGGHHIIIPAILAATSLVLVFMASQEEDAATGRQLLTWAVFCFSLGAGMKNVIILAVPGFFAAILITHGVKELFVPRKLAMAFFAGIMGILLSGAAWNYTFNYLTFKNAKGSPKAIEESVASMDAKSAWTRIVRGITYFSDVTVKPKPISTVQKQIFAIAERIPGVQDILEGEGPDSFWRFPELGPPERSGMGLVGPFYFVALLFTPLFILASKQSGIDTRRLVAVFIYFCLGFILLHILVRWSVLGRFRLSHAVLIPALTLLCVLLKYKMARGLLLTLAFANLSITGLIYLSLGLRKSKSPLPFPLAKIANLSPQRSEMAIMTDVNSIEQSFVLKEAYSNREIFEFISNKFLTSASRIGFVGNFNSVDYFLFGKKKQHTLTPLLVSDEGFLSKLTSVDYVVIEGASISQKEYSLLNSLGFSNVLSFSVDAQTRAEVFAKTVTKDNETN